jgi:hypothetical protein
MDTTPIIALRDNLKQTIAGKRLLLDCLDRSSDPASAVAASFVKINLDELERILVDVETCCQQYHPSEAIQ